MSDRTHLNHARNDWDTIVVEKGVPAPNYGRGRSRLGEIMRQLEVGDSFVLSHKDSSVWGRAHRLGIKITTGKDPRGLRVWRVG